MASYARIILAALLTGLTGLAGLALAGPAQAEETNVVAEWGKLALPAAPELASPVIDKATTALLILDMQPQTCNADRRPRCLPTLAPVAVLAAKAKEKGVPVVYSIIRNSSPADIFAEMRYKDGDPVVASTVDKFLNTNLADILAAKGIKTVIVTGTAAQGAVLHTATAAAQRGLSIIVPVDAISAEDAFTEAAALWCLLVGPASKGKTTLTTSDKIGF